MSATLQNWSGHHTFRATDLHRPQTIAHLQEIVRHSRKIKVIGSRHSFNDIADSTETLISLDNLPFSLTIDQAQNRVTVPGGITYGQLCQELHNAGLAIHNMASLPHITLAGAISTATHGSGDQNGSLASAVVALELVTADGEIVQLRKEDGDPFEGAVVGLGGLGIITQVTLETSPAYEMQQEVYEWMPLAQAADNFDAITSSAYSVSFFTNWQTDRINQVWRKHRINNQEPVSSPTTFYEATLASKQLHPVAELPAEPCTDQMGIPGPWHERLPHFRVDHTPASGDELQTEYFIPRQHAADALRSVARYATELGPLLWMSEIRTIAADTFWMSPFYQRDSVGIHFSWRKNWQEVQHVLPVLERVLAPFQARPHWGKLFTMEPSHLQSLYPRLADFRELLSSYDPTGKFRNPFLDKYIFSFF